MNQMKQELSHKKIIEWLKTYYGWIIVLFGFLALNTSVVDYADDIYFRQAFEQYGSFVGWAKYYATYWSGRIVPHAVLIILLQFRGVVFATCNALAMFFTIFLFNKVFLNDRYMKKPGAYITMSVALIYLYPTRIAEGIFWRCASVLYLWSVPLMMLVIWPVIRRLYHLPNKKYHYILAVLACIYVSGVEQMAAFLMVFIILVELFVSIREKSFNIYNIILALVFCVLSVICLKLPGNAYRSIEETLTWQNNYASFTFSEKIMMGISLALKYLCSDGVFLIFAIATVVTVVTFQTKKSLIIKIIAGIVEFYYSLNFINQMIIEKDTIRHFLIFGKIYTFIPVGETALHYDMVQVIMMGVGLLMLGILAVEIFFLEKDNNIVESLLLLGGFGTIMATGFTSTLVISGLRTPIICTFLLMLDLYMLIDLYVRTMKETNNENKGESK